MAPRIVQWVGDLYEAARAYIGKEREIRVDESNWDLLIHDGTTPGGHRLMNMTNADLRYQKLNSELGGLGPFPPGARGILVRATDTEYILRVMQQTPDAEVTVQNPDGFGGNFVVSLTDIFPRAKTFNNSVTFNGPVVINTNITFGPAITVAVQGTLNVNNLNVAGVISVPPNSIPTSAIAGLDARIRTLGCPLGVIMLWNHNYGGVPAGWAVCDGANGTVDLRDRFVVGAALSYAPGTVGGVVSQNIGRVAATAITVAQMANHTHGIVEPQHQHTLPDPGHSHIVPSAVVVQTGTGVNLGGAGGQFTATVNIGTNLVGIGFTHTDPAGIGIGINANGGDQGHDHATSNFDNRPPFYAEYYIQHIGP